MDYSWDVVYDPEDPDPRPKHNRQNYGSGRASAEELATAVERDRQSRK